MDEQEVEDEDAENYREPRTQIDDDAADENAQGLLAAAGLEDSDADDEAVIYFVLNYDIGKPLLCLLSK